MPQRQTKEQAKLWRVQALNNVEVLKATYTHQTFTKHSHESFGIGLVESGVLDYHTANRDYTILPGELIVINPGQVHWGGPADAKGCTYRIFYPDCGVVRNILEAIDEDWAQLPYFGVSQICDRTLAHRLHQLFNTLETINSTTLERESYLITTLTHLITGYADPGPHLKRIGPEKLAVQKIRDYIEAYYSQNITLNELAELVQFKPLRLLRTFRKEMGLPPHAYLVQVRVNRAKALLAQGQSIIDVALSTGFADQSHLTRHFKRFVGVTPGQYVTGCSQTNRDSS